MYDNHILVPQLNKEVWCKLGPSAIHGIGVIAIRDIPKDTHLWTVGFHGMIEYPIDKLKKECDPAIVSLILDSILMDGGWACFYHPNTRARFQSYMNHSDKANSTGRVALRNIAAGEEVTENYIQMAGGIKGFGKAQLEHMSFLKEGQGSGTG